MSDVSGDGSTDDTNGVQNAFNAVADGNKILHVDAGTYLIGDTVTIPKDAKIVGETWAQFAAFGQKFSDPKYGCSILSPSTSE